MEADVLRESAASVGRLEEDANRNWSEHGDAVSFDVAEAARSFASECDAGGSGADRGVAQDDLFRGAVHPQAVRVASCLQAKRVIVDCNVGVLDQDLARGVDVYAVSGGAVAVFIVADSDPLYGDVMRVADVHRPEAGPAEKRPLPRLTWSELKI